MTMAIRTTGLVKTVNCLHKGGGVCVQTDGQQSARLCTVVLGLLTSTLWDTRPHCKVLVDSAASLRSQ